MNSNSKKLFPATLLLLGVTIAMFGDVLFASDSVFLSQYGNDISSQFLGWREFGFSQLRHGNLALWNPYLFSGVPYLGGFQSALLYPPNFLYLVLPVPQAINWGIALHVFLMGVFMYLWVSYRGLNFWACILSAILMMFCGAHFLHIFAGHLPNLCTMVWTPLIFLAIDGIFTEQSLGWCLLGIFAVTMSILAGHPQYVFYTAITVAIYSGMCLVKAEKRGVILLQIITIYIGAAIISAVQLFTGIQAAGEAVRTKGVEYSFASSFSFPPENLITFFVPKFFGNDTTVIYWGRWYFWEMVCFISIAGLFLAIWGAFYGNPKIRRFSVFMTLILLLMSIGSYTPVYKILYTWMPGINKFRSMSKFMFQTSLFLTLLSGIGFDHLLQYRQINRRIILLVFSISLILFVFAIAIRVSAELNIPTGFWHTIMNRVHSTHQLFISEGYYKDEDYIQTAGFYASKCLIFSGSTCLFLALILFLIKYSYKWVYAVGMLAVLEIFIFGRSSRPTFELEQTQIPRFQSYFSSHPGDYRILDIYDPNMAMLLGVGDIWGNDPGVLRRYAEFISFTQGMNPDQASQYVQFSKILPIFSMLRLRYIIMYDGTIKEIGNAMPRLNLIQNYHVLENRNQVFTALCDVNFNPREQVILEQYPIPNPVKSDKKGVVKIINETSDTLTIEADLPHPAILLITDAYSKEWHARALEGSAQKVYQLIPANYILRAIPLKEGHHRILVEYLPFAYQIGKWVSIIAFILYGLFCVGYYRKKCRRSKSVN